MGRHLECRPRDTVARFVLEASGPACLLAACGWPRMLLLLRNPWGHGEWTGPWSDLSREWDAHPECRAAVGDCRSTDDDGEFWMDIETFCALFASVDMCRLPGGHRHRTKNAELHALTEEDVPLAHVPPPLTYTVLGLLASGYGLNLMWMQKIVAMAAGPRLLAWSVLAEPHREQPRTRLLQLCWSGLRSPP